MVLDPPVSALPYQLYIFDNCGVIDFGSELSKRNVGLPLNSDKLKNIIVDL